MPTDPARPNSSGPASLETKYRAAELAVLDHDGTFAGYASVFGARDLGNDVVEAGAFARSLERTGVEGVKLLYQHDPSEPIGRWLDIREDRRGLFVKGRLLPEVARAREVLALMREGVLDGLSIGFRTVKSRADADAGARRLIEIDLWEISVVTFPLLPAARVVAVKAAGAEAQLATAIRAATTRLRAHLSCSLNR